MRPGLESEALASVISDDVDEQLAGKAFWVIGNVAFLCDKVDDGLRYHELAASTFSPARDLSIWAKFNKASAAMRLAANVADADTLRCIERAELATDVIGGSESDLLLLRRNRAHWSYLAGDAQSAVSILEDICETRYNHAAEYGRCLPSSWLGLTWRLVTRLLRGGRWRRQLRTLNVLALPIVQSRRANSCGPNWARLRCGPGCAKSWDSAAADRRAQLPQVLRVDRGGACSASPGVEPDMFRGCLYSTATLTPEHALR